ncbi:MAG: tetratricopeptide repeat protein [Candidatus Limimorpha sp.]
MRNVLKYATLIFTLLIYITSSAQNQQDSFSSLITNGDAEFNKKEYIKAKTYYQEALRIKPNDASAKNKLNKTLEMIRNENKKEEQFFSHIDTADELYEKGQLENAIAEYDKALKIFPNDEYALNRKNEIRQTLSDEKDKLNAFNEMVSIGDILMKEERFAEAYLQYQSALQLYPGNTAVKQKYQNAKNSKESFESKSAEFERLKSQGHDFAVRKKYDDAINSYNQALTIFPNDNEITEEILRLQELKNTSDSYNTVITQADELYEEQDYQQAKTKYQEALTVIPNDSYATSMITRIDDIVNSDNYQKILRDKAKLDSDFANYLSKGEKAEGESNYEQALTYYNKALELKPSNTEAIAKKANAEKMIMHQEQVRKEQERLAEIEHEKQLKAKVQNLLSLGNQQITEKKYADAENTFKEVLTYDANNQEAKSKLDIIAGFYEEIQKQKEENYVKAMNAGSSAAARSDFAEAKRQYEIALTYKPEDSTARQLLSELAQMENMRNAAIEKEYNDLIVKADAQFDSKNYDKAIELYNKALSVKPESKYPESKINEISEIIKENKLVELVASTVTIDSDNSKRFDFEPVDVTTRRSNYLFIKAKNLSDKQYTMYISYGSSSGKNGGFMVIVPKNNKENDFIIRIGSQYKWFSEDNTWIEITPENGTIEISTIEISKGN